MKKWPDINLPSFEYRVKEEEGNFFIFDVIRKKYIVLTNEEWVRQHFVHMLITHLQYPKSLILVETGLSYFKNIKRSDIAIKHSNGNSFMLIECKAPEIKLDQKTLSQVSIYNKKLKADFLCITNGIKHYIWMFDAKSQSYIQTKEFPKFPD